MIWNVFPNRKVFHLILDLLSKAVRFRAQFEIGLNWKVIIGI